MESSVIKALQTGTISPMLLINWISGIGVIEYPIGIPRPIISVFWSVGNSLVILGFLKMANLSMVITMHGSVIVANTYRVNAYLSTGFVITSICFGLLRSKNIKESRRKLKLMNDRMKRLAIPNDCGSVAKAQIIQIVAFFTVNFIMIVLDFVYIGFDLPSESSRIGFLAVFHYSLIFAYIVDGKFTTSIRYLGTRFQRLNELLAESEYPEMNKRIVTRDSDDQFQRYFPVISEIHRNHSVAIRAAEKRWLLYVIKETRFVGIICLHLLVVSDPLLVITIMIHRDLRNIAIKLNRTFGIQVLLSVALCFGFITALFYTLYIISVLSLSDSVLNNLVPKFIVMTWIMFYAMKILVIVDACDTTSCEANRTGILINKLLHTTVRDEDIRNEMNIFSLQLLQNPLNFTACGFFTLNYSLVHGIIGSVTTYLVILIQMQNIYDLGNVNSTYNSVILMQTNGTT